MKKSIIFFLCFFLIQESDAQQQVSSFTYQVVSQQNPSDFIEYKGLLFFEASTDGFGREIWFSDGNQSHTSLLKDINPGNNNGALHSLKSCSVILNNELYFVATDGSSSGEIWKTDGTTNGTEKVTNFLNANITKLTLVGSNIFFLIQESDSLQVWKSNGTAAGTVLVKSGLPIWNSPSFQGKCNETFIFTFQPYGSNNCRVWRSDGTNDGTFPITGEIDGCGAGSNIGTNGLSQYIEYQNELYFVARSSAIFGYPTNVGIMKTDGTLQNTVPVKAIHDGSQRLLNYGDVIELNDKLYFSFFEVDYNRLFIWESDGNEIGTNKVYDVSGNRYYMTSNLLIKGNSLFFCGMNQSGGTSLLLFDPDNNIITDIKELADSTEIPFIFMEMYSICKIQKLNIDEYFITTPFEDYYKKGWITDFLTNTTNNFSFLDNIKDSFTYDSTLYYAKNGQVWKFITITNTPDLSISNELIIYPNPSSDYIMIETREKLEDICIYNTKGSLVLMIKSLNNKKQINVSGLYPGSYIVECSVDGVKYNRKFIKE